MTTTIRGPRASTVLAVLAALLATAALLLAAAPRASAHDGDAIVEVEKSDVSGLTVDYVVRVTWADDGHAAVDATVTATAIGADGTQLTPVALNPIDTDGRYGGAVELPAAGRWTVRLTSIEPTGTLEVEQQVTAPTTSAPTTTPPTTAADDATGGGSDEGGASDDEIAADETAAADESDGGGSSGMPVAVIVIAAVVVIGGAVAAVRTIVRTRADPPAGGGDGDGGAPPSGGPSSDTPSGAEEVPS
jgi:hypothetical protein